MPRLLRIDASALQSGSHSKELGDFFEHLWLDLHSGSKLNQYDLAKQSIPHIDADFIAAADTPLKDRSALQIHKLALSDQFINELKSCDTLLITTPMYNFSIPSTLKAWIDHITRAGETFRYGEQGPKGLLSIKNVVVITACGGDYSQPPLNQMNFVEPYLKTVLGFLGLTAITFVTAPSMNQSPELKKQALQLAENKICELVAQK